MKKSVQSLVAGTVMLGILTGTTFSGNLKGLNKIAGKSTDLRSFAEMSCKGKQSCKGKKKGKKGEEPQASYSCC
ncbi:hypothetical protein [Methylacidiphilum caldifontis]|uniref:Uncharacterized protein n=1 Tax=Methylacidiphilum caldifontis TaxID=2795386 RepID=A0A4Y8PH34_9BACT|nr:hypothetical protein [Methylacidiphilum caldifontis]TFE71544.1 hypothetical protein A7Q10_04410 [Methylacidiphilum caldifontis]